MDEPYDNLLCPNKEFLVKSIAICTNFNATLQDFWLDCVLLNHKKYRFYRKIVTLFSFFFSGAQEHLRKNVCMIPHRIPVGVMISATEFKDYIPNKLLTIFHLKSISNTRFIIELQFSHNDLHNLIQMKCKLEKKYFA